MLDTKFWEKYFKTYDLLNSIKPYQSLLDMVYSLLNLEDGDKVLEAGCGTGNFCTKLKRLNPKLVVVGLDNNIEALRIYRMKDSDASVVHANMGYLLPFDDSYFDKISCLHALYWLSHSERNIAVKELIRVLKTGGLIVFVNPSENFSSFKISIDAVLDNLHDVGVLSTFKFLVKYSLSSIKIILYTKRLLGGKSNKFLSVDNEYLGSLLSQCGCTVLKVKRVYSNQSNLILAIKK